MTANAVTRASRPFRIIALPLVRIPHGPLRVTPKAGNAPTPSSTASTSPAGVIPHPTHVAPGAAVPDPSEAPLMLYHTQQPDATSDAPPSIYQRALDKASDQWYKLGEKKEGSWMRWFYDKGESLMDRIEYEEWELKNIHEGQGVKLDKDGKPEKVIEIPLLRPTAKDIPPLLPKLHRSLLHRIPQHRKSMWRCLLLSPLTWPFAIIPIIPNFPMFYVLWRAWSHYRAWRGAQYLESLLKAGMIHEKPSEALDKVYEAAAEERKAIAAKSDKPKAAADDTAEAVKHTSEADAAIPADSHNDSPQPQEPGYPRYPGLLLTKGQVPALQKLFDLRGNELIDVHRAIEQADLRAANAAVALKK